MNAESLSVPPSCLAVRLTESLPHMYYDHFKVKYMELDFICTYISYALINCCMIKENEGNSSAATPPMLDGFHGFRLPR